MKNKGQNQNRGGKVSIFNEDEKYIDLIEEPKDISSLLQDDMLLINGDFYGIQKFIFERLATKNAAKVLRAKSAYVQLFTEYLAKYICRKLGVDEDHIITSNAGRFEVLVPYNETIKSTIQEVQKKVDNFFIKNFYGLSGVMISAVRCSRDDFDEGDRYRAFRKNIIDSVEDAKFQKFNLASSDAPSVMEYDTNLTNQCLCRICNIRKITACTDTSTQNEHCEVCEQFIALGKKLSDELNTKIASKNYGISLDDNETIELELTAKIQSYVLRDKNNEIVDFKALSESSEGLDALGILKADVDNMGLFLSSKENEVTKSFEKFDSFSKTIDNFFSLYIPKLMQKDYENTYTVFAGGDDLFLLGAWSEIVALAREIEQEFKVFVQSDKLSISFGIAMAKPSTPISYLAEYAEYLLEEAKGIDGEKEVAHPKDAITLFDETVKWKSYKEVYEKLYLSLENFEVHLNTAFLYRLLALIEMSKKLKYTGDIPSSMWKSKFRYSFNRNVLERIKNTIAKQKAEEVLKLLGRLIDESPKETKMVVSEFIYKRRENNGTA